MNEKLESLMNEMVDEVKSLKDLGKEELPLIVHEYLRYQLASSMLGLLFGISGLIGAAFCLYKGITYVPDSNHYSSDSFGWYVAGTLIGLISIVTTAVNADSVLSVLLQPRRSAIQAITSLF